MAIPQSLSLVYSDPLVLEMLHKKADVPVLFVSNADYNWDTLEKLLLRVHSSEAEFSVLFCNKT